MRQQQLPISFADHHVVSSESGCVERTGYVNALDNNREVIRKLIDRGFDFHRRTESGKGAASYPCPGIFMDNIGFCPETNGSVHDRSEW